jgi:acetylornithine deacetylase/succinyl-diaminopimelate desuccinylase-like protein
LQSYLRIDTSNPPGREAAGASFLKALLHREGIATQLLVPPSGRPSLYARLAAAEPVGGQLILLHHIDAVPAGPGWTVGPTSGELRQGKLWGRGAVDDKSLGIAHLAAFIEMHRRGERLSRDLVFLAVADEEAGGKQGTRWLLEEHPELFADVAAVLGEGGSNRSFDGRLFWWGVEVAQKRPLWLRVAAEGRGGHGSTLNLHTAPHRLVRGLAAVLERPLRYHVSPPVRQYFEAVAPFESRKFQSIVSNLDSIVADEDPSRHLLPGLPSYFLDSIQINALEAGEKVNVAPEEASALIDIRLLPDTDEEAFLAEIRQLLGKNLDVEILLSAPPAEASSVDTRFFDCMEAFLGSRAPVLPSFIPGVTDSRYFRERSIPAYGFSPFLLSGVDLKGIHGPDEHISVEAFEEGVETMKALVRACAGK